MQEINAHDNVLELEQRRALVSAAKVITEMRLDAVTTDSGIFKSNLYSFLSGVGKCLGVPNQFVVMRNYGFAPDGKLLKCLHSWFITSIESFELVRACLKHEIGVRDVVCRYVYTQMMERELVGAYIEFSSESKDFERTRLMLTMNSIAIDNQKFKSSVEGIFDSDIQVGEELDIDNAVARNVWRWRFGKTLRKKTPFPVPPKNSIFPYDFDCTEREKAESADEILEVMLPRFAKLSYECAALSGKKQSSWDVALIKRAKRTLGVSNEN